MPTSRHYLKLFRDKIANYLTIKSLTETNYFDILLREYTKVKNPEMDNMVDELTPEQIRDQKLFLEEIIKRAQDAIDNEEGS
jgi:hypothetical protein